MRGNWFIQVVIPWVNNLSRVSIFLLPNGISLTYRVPFRSNFAAAYRQQRPHLSLAWFPLPQHGTLPLARRMLEPKWICCRYIFFWSFASLIWVHQPRTTLWHYTKEAKSSNSLRVFNGLPFSLPLHYSDKSFPVARGHSPSWSCRRLLKWRLCKIHWGEALWESREPDHRSLVSTVSHIITNKHLRILKSGAARIGWISVPLVNVHRRVVQNNFWRRRFSVLPR